MERDDTTLGEKLRDNRKAAGLTQEELAQELNVTRQSISNWERDLNEPDIGTLRKISALFGMKMDDFIGGVINNMTEKNVYINNNVTEDAEAQENRWHMRYYQAVGMGYALGPFVEIVIGIIMRHNDYGWGSVILAGICALCGTGLFVNMLVAMFMKK